MGGPQGQCLKDNFIPSCLAYVKVAYYYLWLLLDKPQFDGQTALKGKKVHIKMSPCRNFQGTLRKAGQKFCVYSEFKITFTKVPTTCKPS